MPQTLRTFIAVEASPEVRSNAARLVQRLRRLDAPVRWVETSQLHWTLSFLGDVEADRIVRVCDAIKAALADAPPFDLECRGLGAFGDPARPRTLWLGCGAGREAMVELHERIERALEPLGWPREGRRYQPHLTLGRVRAHSGTTDFASALQREADFVAGVTEVDAVVVFNSDLRPSGPEYDAMATIELRGAAT